MDNIRLEAAESFGGTATATVAEREWEAAAESKRS